MSRKATLPTVLKNLYAENSRFDVGPPAYILKELDQNVLALSDIEISDDDVPLLCRFFNHPQACKLIKRVQIDRTSSKKVHVRRPDSAFTSNGCKLMKELFKFIANAKALQSVSFESLEIPVEALPLLGKSLVASASEIMWLGIKDCSIGGDEGMRILTHYIGKLKLQVLAIEQCELTDASLVYIASILKAQQNNLDSLYWNATLRVDPSKRGALWNASEIDAVYRCGLVALSLYGNNLELRDVYTLTRVLRHNHWLLGLNLANNNIGHESMLQFTDEISVNSVLQTVLLKDNPGLDVEIASNLHTAIQSNTVDVTTDTTRDVVEDLELRHSSGYRRLELQTPRIALLLRTWQQLQNIETSVPQVAYPHTHAAAASTTSAATMGSNSPTAMAVRARKGIKAAAAARGSGSATKAGTPKAGTRRAFEAELHAHLSNPYGYSALDLANDQAPSAPVSPYRQSKNGNFSFASFLDNGFSPAVSGLKTENGGRTQGSDGGAIDLNASTSRFNMADFHEPMFDSTGPNKKNILSDSIQLSVDSRDDVAGEDYSQLDGRRHAQHRDTLDLAIPTVSPVKNNSVGATPQSEYYIGMDSKKPSKSLLSFVQSEMQAQAKNDLAEMQTREEAWGNIEWPVSDDPLDRADSDDALQSGRPPSRISIRRRGSGSSNGRSPSPTHEAVDDALEREYRRRMQQLLHEEAAYAARRQSPAHRRPASAPDARQSTSRGTIHSHSQPNYLRHTNASVAAGAKPFYAGGQARPSSPPKFSREELAKMYGLIPYGRPEERYRRHSSPAQVHRKKVTKRRRSVPTAPKRDASPTLGKARGPGATRIRARSAERSGSAGRGVDARADNGRGEPSRSSANRGDIHYHEAGHGGVRRSGDDSGVRDSVRVINELSATVLNATRNLETVSTKLKDVIEGLSTSMDMNLTIQRELLSGSMMNTTMGGTVGGGGLNVSRAWASPAGLSAVHATPMSHSHSHRPLGVSGVKASPGDAPSPSSARAAAMRYRDLSSSPVSFNVSAHHHEHARSDHDDHTGHHVHGGQAEHSGYHGRSAEGQWGGGRTQQDDAGLKELIRSRMEQKLRSILEENN